MVSKTITALSNANGLVYDRNHGEADGSYGNIDVVSHLHASAIGAVGCMRSEPGLCAMPLHILLELGSKATRCVVFMVVWDSPLVARMRIINDRLIQPPAVTKSTDPQLQLYIRQHLHQLAEEMIRAGTMEGDTRPIPCALHGEHSHDAPIVKFLQGTRRLLLWEPSDRINCSLSAYGAALLAAGRLPHPGLMIDFYSPLVPGFRFLLNWLAEYNDTSKQPGTLSFDQRNRSSSFRHPGYHSSNQHTQIVVDVAGDTGKSGDSSEMSIAPAEPADDTKIRLQPTAENDSSKAPSEAKPATEGNLQAGMFSDEECGEEASERPEHQSMTRRRRRRDGEAAAKAQPNAAQSDAPVFIDESQSGFKSQTQSVRTLPDDLKPPLPRKQE